MRRPPEPDADLLAFYTSVEDEAARLSLPQNRLEFIRTQALVRARLPVGPARVLDVGGGAGAHAVWLAADGYDVELIDPVPAHVRAAREAARALPRPFRANEGDARALDAPDSSVDVCLMLGPLYHLPSAQDRATALAEAFRVTRAGGLLAVAAISRFAWPMYELRHGDDPSPYAESIATVMRSGRGDPGGYLPSAFSHRPDELVNEISGAGFSEIELLGIEGPGWMMLGRQSETQDMDALLSAMVCVARLYDDHPEMAVVSAHLLGCARRPLR